MTAQKYNLELAQEAVQLCTYIEPRLRPLGWHVALTGSALYGKLGDAATKDTTDIDIAIYPHHDESIDILDEPLDEIMVRALPSNTAITLLGEHNDEYGNGDSVAEFYLPTGTKVNVFQLAWMT